LVSPAAAPCLLIADRLSPGAIPLGDKDYVVTVANRLTIAGLTAVAMSMVDAFVFVTDIRSVRRLPWWPASQQGRRCWSYGVAFRWLADALSPGPGPPGVSVPQRRAGPAGDLSRIPRAGRTLNRRRYEGYVALQRAKR
jgi:hypothetical protein